MTTQARLNSFAIRSFRDVADQDYIAARMSYRTALYSQFHWSALQAVEKYIKGILLLNRVRAKNLSHDLALALKALKKLPFEVRLSKISRDFIDHLDRVGAYRYLESSYYVMGPKVIELDRTVWELRRYCKVMDYTLRLEVGTEKRMLDLEVAGTEAHQDHPHRLRIRGGVLEKIIDSTDHPAREQLLWQNGFFGRRSRKRVRVPMPFHATNAPLTLDPELVDDVLEYVFLPKHVAEAYRELANEQNRMGA
jgi:HEPN domain-containing protein